MPEAPAAHEFEDLLSATGWQDVQGSACNERKNVTGPVTFCTATATALAGEAKIELTAAGPVVDGDTWYRVTLRVYD